jgi:hypothetical protein
MRGRKQKKGKRTPSGQLSRAGKIKHDKGTQAAQDKFSIYGTDGSDAIGRAFRKGLLGQDGESLMQTARAIARAYWPVYGTGRISCTLAEKTGVGGDGSLEKEQWLSHTLGAITRMGQHRRIAFDELVINPYIDRGPPWLDRLIESQPLERLPADLEKLEWARDGLIEIAGLNERLVA